MLKVLLGVINDRLSHQAWPKEARAEDTEPESTARTVWVIPNTYPHVSMSRASVRRLNYEKVL